MFCRYLPFCFCTMPIRCMTNHFVQFGFMLGFCQSGNRSKIHVSACTGVCVCVLGIPSNWISNVQKNMKPDLFGAFQSIYQYDFLLKTEPNQQFRLESHPILVLSWILFSKIGKSTLLNDVQFFYHSAISEITSHSNNLYSAGWLFRRCTLAFSIEQGANFHSALSLSSLLLALQQHSI